MVRKLAPQGLEIEGELLKKMQLQILPLIHEMYVSDVKGTLPFLQPVEIQWMYICQKCFVGCIHDSKMEFLHPLFLSTVKLHFLLMAPP